MGHKSKHHKKSDSSSTTVTVEVKKEIKKKMHKHVKKAPKSSYSNSIPVKNQGCGCVENYYMPLPNLSVTTTGEQVTPLAWLRPGLVQGSCTQCSSVRPIYATPCSGYCCNNNY